MKKRSGSKALVEALERVGADIVFGYPGGNVIDIFDELSRSSFRFVLGRHEQGCVHMADGYARASGRPAVVMVTSGPGLTNTITGLGAANMDGVPMVLVCGQVPLDQIGTDAFQEADTTGLTRAVSKHNFLVHSADEIPETVAQAFYIATHGKPGPVVIDVPRDCQQALTAAEYPERVVLRAYHPEVSATASQVGRLAKLVNGAKRPVILAGGGVIASGASEDVATLAHKAGIPAATKGKAIVVTDVGQHQIWAAKVFKHTRPRHFITSGGMGAMGFGIPAAIGAALARPDSKVVAFLGDGGAQMTAEELLVAVELRLPVTFVVLSNGSLGLVRQMQRHMCGGNYFATDISSPDFVKLAAAYGMRGFRVADGTKLDAVLARAAGARKPTLVEVVVDREAEA